MRFDRNTYFSAVRDVLFEGALTQQQVDGQSVIATTDLASGDTFKKFGADTEIKFDVLPEPPSK